METIVVGDEGSDSAGLMFRPGVVPVLGFGALVFRAASTHTLPWGAPAAQAAASAADDRVGALRVSPSMVVRVGGTVYVGGDCTMVANRTGSAVVASLRPAKPPICNQRIRPPLRQRLLSRQRV